MAIRSRFVAISACVCALVGAAAVLVGQTARGQDGAQRPPSWWTPPADVRSMLGDISAQRLEADDRALVDFGTRSTLSSQTDPKRGIGAAGNRIFGQLKDVAATSNGRMTVEPETYHQPPVNGRIPNPNGVDVTNTTSASRTESSSATSPSSWTSTTSPASHASSARRSPRSPDRRALHARLA